MKRGIIREEREPEHSNVTAGWASSGSAIAPRSRHDRAEL